MGCLCRLDSTVIEIKYKDVFGPKCYKTIHDVRSLVLEDHRADGHPIFVVQGADCRCAATWCHGSCFVELGTANIVFTDDVAAGGDHSGYATCDKTDEGIEGRVLLDAGLDEHGFCLKYGGNRVEARCAHGIPRFYQIDYTEVRTTP